MQKATHLIPNLALGTVFAALFFVIPHLVFAQTAGNVTSVQHPTIDYTTCGATAGPEGSCERKNADGSITSCGGALGSAGNCQVNFPDGSYTNIAPGNFSGQTITNFDASGKQIGVDNGSDSNALVHDQSGQQNNPNVTATGGQVGGGSCKATEPWTWMDCFLDGIATFILGITNFVLGLCGVLLNWIIVKTVFQFSTLIGNSAGLLTAWRILRDLGNLLLLFGFIFMGISIILDSGKFADKKAIPALIVFAVLINFSIFAAEAVIDTSNVLTSVMYSQANTDPCVDTQCNINDGIAGRIMESTGLSSIYNLGTNGYKVSGTAKLLIIFGLSIFAVIGIVVILSAAIMLAIRAIILTGLIIVSPIGFAGLALPPLQATAKKWWKMLFEQAFFAPLLFLFIFISLKVTEGFSSVGNNQGLASALVAGNGTSNMGIIMVFVLVSGAMIASLIAAKSFGGQTATFAINTAGSFAGRATFGTGSAIARQYVGGTSAAVARGIRASNLGTTTFGRTLAGVADKGASASYDPRTIINKQAKKLGKNNVINLGEPSAAAKKGYVGEEKAKIKVREDYAKTLGLTDAQKKRKKALEDEKKTQQDAQKTESATFDAQKKPFVEQKNQLDSAWRTREAEINGKMADHQKKTDENVGGAKVSELEQQIAAEKLNGQRLQSQGTIADVSASNARVAELEKQRDAYINAEAELTKLRDNKLQELTTYTNSVKAVEEDIKRVDALKAQSDAAFAERLGEINAELGVLNDRPKELKEQYADTLEMTRIIGGRANTEAANKIRASIGSKSNSQKIVEAVETALKEEADAAKAANENKAA